MHAIVQNLCDNWPFGARCAQSLTGSREDNLGSVAQDLGAHANDPPPQRGQIRQSVDIATIVDKVLPLGGKCGQAAWLASAVTCPTNDAISATARRASGLMSKDSWNMCIALSHT